MKIQWQTISFSSIVGQKSIQSHFGWGATFSQVLLQVILHYLIYCTGLKFALMAYTLLWAESKWSVCNFSCSVMDSAALAAFYFPALKGIEKCARWPLKEEFHLLLAPCFSSVHFFFFCCNAQLSKHEERLDIRRQHLSPHTHKPLEFFGRFSCIWSGLSSRSFYCFTRPQRSYLVSLQILYLHSDFSLCCSLVSSGHKW